MNGQEKKRVDDVMVAYPLFQMEGGGSIPTLAHQLWIEEIPRDKFIELNRLWHSRLPDCGGFVVGDFYGAMYDGCIYAVAWWSDPVARLLNGRGMWELRRLATSPQAPKNTASFMLSRMRKAIQVSRPNVKTLISYQDTEVHTGTIYKAAGWKSVGYKKLDKQGWTTRPNRQNQSTADKIRWEFQLSSISLQLNY